MSIEFAEFEHQRGLPQQRELFENAFPENNGTPAASVEHYQWKFHGFPASPPSYEYEAAEDGKMLGYYAAIPYAYEVSGRRLRAGMVCDVMTHSDARGRGVFTELGRFSLARMQDMDLDFVTGYPIRPEVMGGHIRVGWRVAFELPMYLKPLRANAILTSKGMPWLAPVANLAISIARTLLAPRRAAAGYRGTEGAPRELFHSAAFERFLDAWSAEVPNHLVKSAEFYDWRLGAPGTEYRAFLVHRGEQVVAAAVGRAVDLDGIPSFALLDVMARKGHERALRVLYGDIEKMARRRRAEAIVTMMSKPRARDYRLLRFGFLKSPFVFKLIIRSLNDQVAVERLSQVEDWHLMWIDSDDL